MTCSLSKCGSSTDQHRDCKDYGKWIIVKKRFICWMAETDMQKDMQLMLRCKDNS